MSDTSEKTEIKIEDPMDLIEAITLVIEAANMSRSIISRETQDLLDEAIEVVEIHFGRPLESYTGNVEYL